jgi:hypothetical protein
VKTTETKYTVDVVGKAWSGHQIGMSFDFDHPPTDEEIKARTGDFEKAYDWRITETKTVTEHSTTLDWYSEHSEDLFADAMFPEEMPG